VNLFLLIIALLFQNAAQLNADLISAVKRGDAATVRFLLQQRGINPNAKDAEGVSALMWCAERGFADVAQLLIDRGAAVDQADASGTTPFLLAAARGRTDMVRLLLNSRAKVNDQARGLATTALMFASNFGYVDMIDELLDRGADPNTVQADGATALMLAAQAGQSEAVEKLIRRGADVNRRHRDGRTALMLAAGSGTIQVKNVTDSNHRSIVNALLAANADVSVVSRNGRTVLTEAGSTDHNDLVPFFLARGANPNHADPDGATPMIYSARSGSITALLWLLTFRGELSVRTRDGYTPLMEAVLGGNREIAPVLLKLGVNPEEKTRYGLTAADLAADKENHVMLETLKGFKPITHENDGEAATIAAPVRELVQRAYAPGQSQKSLQSSIGDASVYRVDPTLLEIQEMTSDETRFWGDYVIDRGTFTTAGAPSTPKRYLILCERQSDAQWHAAFIMLG
jgi:ankyrin repeat protein